MADAAMKDMKKDIYLMLHKALEMVELTEDAFVKNRVASLDHSDELAMDMRAREDRLTESLSKLASSSGDARAILGVPAQIEKIANNLKRMNEGIRTKIKESLLFSDKAMQEAGTLFARTKEILKKAGEATITSNPSLAETVKNEADGVIRMSESFATAHEDRLVTGECSPKASSTYLCVLYSFEDVVAHTKEVVRKLVAK
jgi:Na+/phosphate symporter